MSQHHDPVHPDSDHPTAEVLADLDLGLLDAASTTHAEQHLAHCPECADRLADFTELGSALLHLPPEPMPDEVWQSLSEALAADPVVTPAGSATVVPLDATRRRRWARPGIGLVAGAAGVALVGAIVVPSLSGSDNEVSSTAGGGPSAAADNEAGVPMAAYAATTSGTKYQEEAIDSQVTQLVASRSDLETGDVSGETATGISAAPSISPTGEAFTDGPKPGGHRSVAAMATDPAAAQACLEEFLESPGIAPLAIDIGTWQGEPAAVFVLPVPDPTSAEVWVIDPDCSGPDTRVYYFATVSR